jgi:hypothetical protein
VPDCAGRRGLRGNRRAARFARAAPPRRRARVGRPPRSASTLCSASGSCTGSRTRWGCCGVWPRCWRRAVACWSRPTGSRATAASTRTIEVQQPGGVSAGDDYVYWGFGAGGLAAIAQLAGPAEARVDATVVLDWHADHGDTDTGEDASRLTSTAKRGRPKQCADSKTRLRGLLPSWEAVA